MVGLRSIVAACDLDHIERELYADMSTGLLVISDHITVFAPQLGVFNRNRRVHGDRMPLTVSRVMSHGAKSKRVFIAVFRFLEKVENEIAASNVVHQVAEELAAERVVAHVLNDASTVGIGMRLYQISGRGARESTQKQRLQTGVPRGINNRFMTEDGVGREERAQHEEAA